MLVVQTMIEPIYIESFASRSHICSVQTKKKMEVKMGMSFEVKQIEAIELDRGYIQVRRELRDYSDALTIEVRDDRRYLKATT